jgi:hypothetical protein
MPATSASPLVTRGTSLLGNAGMTPVRLRAGVRAMSEPIMRSQYNILIYNGILCGTATCYPSADRVTLSNLFACNLARQP